MGKTYIGIDPGAKGGIAVIGDGGACAHPYSPEVLRATLEAIQVTNALCFVEQVGAMPGQGVTSMFNFGKGYGYILGVLDTLGIPYQTVSPRKWKKAFSLSNDKKLSVSTAKRLFPTVSLLPTERCRKESDGMAEALLIALYAARTDGRADICLLY